MTWWALSDDMSLLPGRESGDSLLCRCYLPAPFPPGRASPPLPLFPFPLPLQLLLFSPGLFPATRLAGVGGESELG